jgi:hypothetical protein
LERLRRETVVKFEKVYYPGFAWRNWGKSQKPSVRIDNLRAKTGTRDLSNTLKVY